MTDLNQLDEAHVPLEKADQLGSKEQEHTEISDTDTKATEIEEIASDVGVDGAETVSYLSRLSGCEFYSNIDTGGRKGKPC